MVEYKFEPDYEAWWGKDDISRQQMMCLALGLDPNFYSSYLDRESLQVTQYNAICAAADQYIENTSFKDIYSVQQIIAQYCDVDIWGQGEEIDREYFIKNIYIGKVQNVFVSSLYGRYEISIHKEFINFLKHKGLWLSIYDEYLKWETFDYDYLTERRPNKQESAVGFVLGLNARYLNKAVCLFKKSTDAGSFSDEEEFFYRQYMKYIYKKFDGATISYISTAIDKIYFLNEWDGRFDDYVQKLHNNGVIFTNAAYKILNSQKIELSYNQDGWAYRFYQEWINKGLWNLEEAAALYRGSNPEGGREFIGFASAESGYNKRLTRLGYFYSSNDEKLEKLDAFLKNHIDAGNLKIYGEEKKFKPKDITEFLLEHFPRTCKPQALFDVLGIYDKNKCNVIEAPNTSGANDNENRDLAFRVLEEKLKAAGYNLKELPFRQRELAEYLNAMDGFKYIMPQTIVTHYIKKRASLGFKRGARGKNLPELKTIISTN